MSFVLQSWQLLVIIVSAWMTKLPQELIDYVMTENQVLKEKLGGKRGANQVAAAAEKPEARTGVDRPTAGMAQSCV